MAAQTPLVVSAHAADFVWCAGGALALDAAKGYALTIVCLSFGERGEAAKLGKDHEPPRQRVQAARRKTTEDAANTNTNISRRITERGNGEVDGGPDDLCCQRACG